MTAKKEPMVDKAAYDKWLARALANAERVYSMCAPQMDKEAAEVAEYYLNRLRDHITKCRENLAQNPGTVFPESVASQWMQYIQSTTQIFVNQLGGM